MKSEGTANWDGPRFRRIGMDLGRVLALDLGKQRIGLALSDESQVIAQGLETLEGTNIREDLARLSQLAADNSVSLIGVRYPLHMSGREAVLWGSARVLRGPHLGASVSPW